MPHEHSRPQSDFDVPIEESKPKPWEPSTKPANIPLFRRPSEAALHMADVTTELARILGVDDVEWDHDEEPDVVAINAAPEPTRYDMDGYINDGFHGFSDAKGG